VHQFRPPTLGEYFERLSAELLVVVGVAVAHQVAVLVFNLIGHATHGWAILILKALELGAVVTAWTVVGTGLYEVVRDHYFYSRLSLRRKQLDARRQEITLQQEELDLDEEELDIERRRLALERQRRALP
jgi:hypothetical protein